MQSVSDQGDWMLALRPRYLSLTADRCSELEALRAGLFDGIDPRVAVARIGGISHKIAGTADSFGYCQLGELARDIEDRCPVGVADKNHDIAKRTLAIVRPLLDRLIAELSNILTADA